MKRMMLALLIVMLAAMPALAADKPAQKMDLDTFFAKNTFQGPAYNGRDMFQGFEDNIMPPAGWTVGVTAVGLTWTTGTPNTGAGVLEGLYCAYNPWDYTAIQDETMSFDHLIDVAGGEYILSFWMAGVLGSDWDLNVAETVEVNGVTVFDFDSNVTQEFTFEKFFVDLSAYDGQTVTITFRYQGVDGDIQLVDAIMIDDGTGYEPPPPPPAPLNDTCEGAYENEFFIAPGAFSYAGDNTLAANDYPMVYPSCTGYSFSGQDLVWVVCMDQGDVLDVTMDAGFDASFFLLSDCVDPDTSCVIGADDPETFVYTAAATGMYYLVCGGYSSGVGPFTISGTLTGAGCDPVATEDTNWGGLKSLYR